LRELCGHFKACKTIGDPSKGGLPFFAVETVGRELDAILPLIQTDVEFVEVDGVVTLDPEEDDELGALQSESWGLDRIDAPNRFASGQGAHIYVIDTGIRITHEDFGGRALATIDAIIRSDGQMVVCDELDPLDPNYATCGGDIHGHGTHCAGTAAGTRYGVASSALVHAVKGLSDQGPGSTLGLLGSLDWIATKGERPAVASLSLGGTGVSEAWRTSIDAAVAQGVTVVVTAGNADSDSCTRSPAHVRSAITVGSTTSMDVRSGFSGWGECVDLWAPGSRILSASQKRDDLATVKSGTSMACPHVSGAAALVLSANTLWAPAKVYEYLVNISERSALSDLKPSDKNMLLWVGARPAPSPAATPEPIAKVCPSFAIQARPDDEDDCRCQNMYYCSRTDGGQIRDCPTAVGIGTHGGRYFQYTCADCQCYPI